MRRRGFTILELLISSTFLLLIIGMGSMSLVSFLRGYQKFSVTSVNQRANVQAMQSFVMHLHSAEQLYGTEAFEKLDLAQRPLQFFVYGTDGPVLETWKVSEKKLWQDQRAIGPAESVVVRLLPNHYLEVVEDGNRALVDWSDVVGPQ